jgi:hypothetical protein
VFKELKTYEELIDFVINDDGLVTSVFNFTACDTNLDTGNVDVRVALTITRELAAVEIMQKNKTLVFFSTYTLNVKGAS